MSNYQEVTVITNSETKTDLANYFSGFQTQNDELSSDSNCIYAPDLQNALAHHLETSGNLRYTRQSALDQLKRLIATTFNVNRDEVNKLIYETNDKIHIDENTQSKLAHWLDPEYNPYFNLSPKAYEIRAKCNDVMANFASSSLHVALGGFFTGVAFFIASVFGTIALGCIVGPFDPPLMLFGIALSSVAGLPALGFMAPIAAAVVTDFIGLCLTGQSTICATIYGFCHDVFYAIKRFCQTPVNKEDGEFLNYYLNDIVDAINNPQNYMLSDTNQQNDLTNSKEQASSANNQTNNEQMISLQPTSTSNKNQGQLFHVQGYPTLFSPEWYNPNAPNANTREVHGHLQITKSSSMDHSTNKNCTQSQQQYRRASQDGFWSSTSNHAYSSSPETGDESTCEGRATSTMIAQSQSALFTTLF